MKHRRVLATTIAILSTAALSKAGDFNWDTVTGDGAALTPGNGTWNLDAGNLIWNDGVGSVAWVNGNRAVFGGGDGTYSISIGATGLSAAGLLFNSSGYTLSAAAATTIANTGDLSVAAGKTATIGSNVTITRAGNNPTINGGGTLILKGAYSGTGTQNMQINGGTTVDVQTGGALSNNLALVVGTVAGSVPNNDGTLLVSGGTVTTTGLSNLVLGNIEATSTTAVVTITSGNINVSATATDGIRFGSRTQTAGSVTGTFNLDGGTVTAPAVSRFTPTGTGAIDATFNFNGGTLVANRTNTAFVSNLTTANVKAGGAKINSNNFTIGIPQALLDGGGGGGLTKQGAGTLTLKGANTYTGTTTVETGTLVAGNNTALGTTAGGTTVNVGAMLLLSNGVTVTGETAKLAAGGTGIASVGALATEANATATWAGDIDLSGGTGRVGGGAGGTLTITGAITNGTDFAISTDTTTPTGTVILAGTASYTGVTQVVRGTLKLGANDVLPTGTILDVHNGPTPNPATFDLNGFNQTVSTLRRTDTGGPATVTNTSATGGTLTVSGDTSTTFSGTITGAALSLTKGGSSTLTLTGNNTYGGVTTINNGKLKVGAGGTTGSIGAGDIVNNGTLEFSRSDATTVANTISGSGGLNFIGTGVTNLTGTNTYTGATNINAGRVNVTGSLASNITVANGANLGGEGATTGTISFNGTNTLFFDPTTPGSLAASTVLASTGTIQVSLTAPTSAVTGIVVLNAPGGITGTAGVGGNFQFSGRGTVYLNGTNTQLLFDYTPANIKWKGGDATNPTFWDTQTTFNWDNAGSPDQFFAADSVLLDDTASSFSVVVQSPGVQPGVVTFNNSANAYSLSGAAISGVGSIVKNGTNTLTVTNDNTFSGGTTIDTGTIQLGDGVAATGSLGTGAIHNNGTLVLNYGTNNVTLANVLSGTGAVTKNGTGTLAVTGVNSYSGVTTIANGTLQLNGSGTLGTGAVVNQGSLVLNRTGAYTLANAIGGTGSVTSQNNGLVTLGSGNSYSGTTTVTTGAILVTANSGVLGDTTGGTVASGAVGGGAIGLAGNISYDAGETLTISGTGPANTDFFFPGSVNQRGALQSVTGNNTWNGNVIVAATNTRIGVQDDASLTISGTITESTGNTTVIFRLGSTTGSDVILSGTGNLWTGETQVFGSGGALKLGANDALPTGTLLRLGTSGVVGSTFFDLNGFNQTVAGLSQVNAQSAVVTNNGANPSVLSLVSDGAAQAYPQVIRDGTQPISLVKGGSFTQTLSGANTYTGSTDVKAGTLAIGAGGSISGSTSINVYNGATLDVSAVGGGFTLGATQTVAGGDGTGPGMVSGVFTAAQNSTVSPGLGAGNTGTLRFANSLTLQTGARLKLDITGLTAGSGYDQVVVAAGNISLAGDLAGSTITLAPTEFADVFFIIVNNGSGTTTGTLNGVGEGGSLFIGSQQFQISYHSDFGGAGFTVGGTGNDVALLAVPEPGSALALLGGLGMVLGLRRRR